ncbi:zinc finger CCCH domain-containing protein 22-like [Phragmites australis]|uniref:zinc finger CCCH domain-containing protein 22-like n=1 Tax=Phragmites australis TaxID=29695 RepID=UPI002D79F412|nr:zinc finger CCCH domain-containing protein 22-like [Phragmites australis]
MDAYEATKVVFSRIQALDPDHAAKIMGLLLIQDHGEKEMIRLAFGPESLLHAVMAKARKDLGLLLPASPTSVAAAGHSPFLQQLSRQSSGRAGAGAPSPLSVSSPSSWAQAPVFSRSNSATNGAAEDATAGAGDELPSPVHGGAAPFFPQAGDPLLDDMQLQEQLAFLNEGGVNPAHQLPAFDGGECRSPGPGDGGGMFPYGVGWPNGGPAHRRSASVNELLLSGGGDGFGWKPCLYYARGFCKNGSSCRFVHGGLPDDAAALAAAKMDAAAEQQQQQQCQDFLLRSKSPRIGPAAFPYSPTCSLPGSPSAASKCLSLLLQQQQHDRAAAAAALMLGGGDEAHKFMGRPRLDRADFASMMNPGSRQIYLTFPADSTFREEDVSNYFSIYGPVHDVRIPYQQKRMFGFVTFVYPETVKLILAKGNPHFICDARVLVKPYKEKGKVPDKYRKQQQGDFSGCTTPTGLDGCRDPFDLHQLGARMLQHSNSANELLLRRKLEEQQQAAELQQAIELQSRRLMGLQLLDLKSRAAAATTSTLPTPVANAFASSQPVSSTTVESPPKSGEQLELSCGFALEVKVNGGDKEESAGEASPIAADSDQSAEHNLPDSPFASPTKSAAFAHDGFPATEAETAASRVGVDSCSNADGGGNHVRPPALDIPTPRPYFFPMHRLSSDHGAMGM